MKRARVPGMKGTSRGPAAYARDRREREAAGRLLAGAPPAPTIGENLQRVVQVPKLETVKAARSGDILGMLRNRRRVGL